MADQPHRAELRLEQRRSQVSGSSERARAPARHRGLAGEGGHAGEQEGDDEPAHERQHARSQASAVAAVAPPGEEERGEGADEAERRAELDEAHEDPEKRHPDGRRSSGRGAVTIARTMPPATSARAAAMSPTRSGLIGAEPARRRGRRPPLDLPRRGDLREQRDGGGGEQGDRAGRGRSWSASL